MPEGSETVEVDRAYLEALETLAQTWFEPVIGWETDPSLNDVESAIDIVGERVELMDPEVEDEYVYD